MRKNSPQPTLDLEPEQPIPQMPEGYYSGDQPNPTLRAFVEQHLKEHPYDPETDDYAVPAFDRPIGEDEATKATAIYNMHPYWSKKPHGAIQAYVRHYTKPGDLVLDPFCGSGGTALVGLMEGCKAIAIDRSPAATFITKNYCTPVDARKLEAAFEELKARVKPEMDWLYATRCDRCGGSATTGYTVYSQVFQCPRCQAKLPLFDCKTAQSTTAKGAPKEIYVCPHCEVNGFREQIKTSSALFGAIPVLVSYLCDAGCKPKRDERRHNDDNPRKREYFEKCDLAKLREIEGREIPYWYPHDRMMHAPEDQMCWGVKWRAGTSNFRTVDELFTKRNLWALAAIRSGIESLGSDQRDRLLLALNGAVLNSSKLYRNRLDGGGGPTGTYYMPQESREMPAWTQVAEKITDQLRPASVSRTLVVISTQTACDLSSIAANSIDYIFTDPPYAGKVQYGELNFVWEAWLGLDTHWHDEEMIVNEVRGKSEADWADGMRRAMSECYRVLKPGRWISLCYHDTSEGTWALLQDIMAEAGFLPDTSATALFIDTGQKSYNQLTADKVNKRDLVINFRKPKPGEAAAEVIITGSDDERTIHEKVIAIVLDYLSLHPGVTKDRVYDEVVSRLVRAGQMERHNFEELLAEVAEGIRPEGADDRAPARWFLKGAGSEDAQEAETAREAASAGVLLSFMERHLAGHPENDGVHYSDLFEAYVYGGHEKPRRPLAEWLPDFFPRTDSGTYRLPLPEEEDRLKAIRQSGATRNIKRYVTFLEQELPIPAGERPEPATLASWIRHCKNAHQYAWGRLLFERGGFDLDRLSEEAAVDAQEDYDTCGRELRKGASSEPARGGPGDKATKGRGDKAKKRKQGDLGL